MATKAPGDKGEIENNETRGKGSIMNDLSFPLCDTMSGLNERFAFVRKWTLVCLVVATLGQIKVHCSTVAHPIRHRIVEL